MVALVFLETCRYRIQFLSMKLTAIAKLSDNAKKPKLFSPHILNAFSMKI